MRAILCLAAGLAAVVGVAAGSADQVDSSSLAQEWLPDWKSAQEAARQTGKPIFLVIRCER
jgi:hypothetical protein